MHTFPVQVPDFNMQSRPSSSPPHRRASPGARRRSASDNKANDVVLLDLHGVTDMTDYFVIASGHVGHARAQRRPARAGDDGEARGARGHHVEGLTQGRWVLLDFVDFVVHVFHPSLRVVLPARAAVGRRPRGRRHALSRER